MSAGTLILRCIALTGLCLPMLAGSLTVTVKDPGQALVSEAKVEVTAQTETVPQTKSTDATGRATFDQLPAGTYNVSVKKEGFAPWEGHITVADRPVNLTVPLKITTLSTSVRVTARRSPLLNSDPNYQSLRTTKLTKVYQVSNLVLTRDAGSFTFRSGSFSFLPPVLNHVTTGVFVGEGNFQLKTADALSALRLKHMAGAEEISEDFTAMVVFFSFEEPRSFRYFSMS